MDWLDLIRNLVATRGAQLVARYAGIGIGMLATKLAVTTDVNGMANAIGAFVAAGVLLLIDHWSHGKQGKAK